MKAQYIEKSFKPETQAIINKANEIIDEYAAEGLMLTLRQIYYQFVARDLIANKMAEYKRLGSIINDGRLAGLIDWNAIEDRTRNLQANYHNTDPADAMQDALDYFMLDHWADQEYRPEVWIEKEALVGVIDGICKELDVPYFACKGYVSQSEMWSAAQRLNRHGENGQQSVIIHLGDHDPSGMDMTRDINDRQNLFADNPPIVRRIALNMSQVDQFNPPPNPAKLTDTRANGYISEFGSQSWELDALEPKVLRHLIESTVKEYRDDDTYANTLEQQAEYRKVMENLRDNWEDM